MPTLSGIRRETTAVVVRGDALAAGLGSETALPAHDIDRYQATAVAVDAHSNETLRDTIANLPALYVNGERMVFTATRVSR